MRVSFNIVREFFAKNILHLLQSQIDKVCLYVFQRRFKIFFFCFGTKIVKISGTATLSNIVGNILLVGNKKDVNVL